MSDFVSASLSSSSGPSLSSSSGPSGVASGGYAEGRGVGVGIPPVVISAENFEYKNLNKWEIEECERESFL